MEPDSTAPSKERRVSFDPKWLKAAEVMSAKNDIRYYLNGVLVEVLDDEVRLVATDGHKMFFLRKKHTISVPARLIVPNEVLALLKLKKQSKYQRTAIISYGESERDKATLEYDGLEIGFRPIDGVFPNYDKILAEGFNPSGETAHFNPAYFGDFQRAVAIAFGKSSSHQVTIWPNGGKPAPVTYRSETSFYGLIMPLRLTETYSAPDWAKPKEEPQPEVREEEALAA